MTIFSAVILLIQIMLISFMLFADDTTQKGRDRHAGYAAFLTVLCIVQSLPH